jgi:transcriptional regulator NrdR family protein
MSCPVCGSAVEVYDSRPEGQHVRRRRKCNNGHRFNTLEVFIGPVRSSLNQRVEPIDEDVYDGDVEAALRAEANDAE